MIYLDSAATTLQKPYEVGCAVADALRNMASPGRGGHYPAQLAADSVYRCRETAAVLFDVPSPEQVVFTANATHGLNIAIRSLVKPGDTVLISGYEHNAVTRTLWAIPHLNIKVVDTPLFEPDAFLAELERKMTHEVSCVILTHVSNVFGYVLPVDEAAYLCRKWSVPLIVDASQSAGSLPVSLTKWKAAFVAMPGHKGLYGPQGTGILLCGQESRPLLFGGTGSESLRQQMPDFLPDRLEAGTHNVCGIAGLLMGMQYIQRRGITSILRHEQSLVERMAMKLSEVPGIEFFSKEGMTCQAGVLSFWIDGMDCELLGERLGEQGIAVRAGLHCAPLAHQTAGTLEKGTVRASVSDFNHAWEIDRFAQIVAQIVG